MQSIQVRSMHARDDAAMQKVPADQGAFVTGQTRLPLRPRRRGLASAREVMGLRDTRS